MVVSLALALTLLTSPAAPAAAPPPELLAAEQALAQAKASPGCPPADLSEAETGLRWARDAAAKGDQALARTLAATAQQLVGEAVTKAQAAATQDRERVGHLFAKAFESAQETDRAGAGKLASREVEAAQKLLGAAQTAANTCQFRQAEDLVGQAIKAFADAANVAKEREAERAKAEEARRAKRETKTEPPAPVTPLAGPQPSPGGPPQLKQPTLTLKTPEAPAPSPAAPAPPRELPLPSPPPKERVPEKAPPEAKVPKGAGIILLGLEVIPAQDGAQVLLTLDGTLEPILHAPQPPSDIMTVDLPGVKQIQGPTEVPGSLPFIKSIRAVRDAGQGSARLLIDLAHDIPVFVSVTMFDGDPANPRLVPTRIILTFLRDTTRAE